MLKTPVSLLQELTVQKKIAAPDYQPVCGTGQPHCMSFTCQVKVGNQTATGAGNTKKEAKQDAARNMLINFGMHFDEQSQSQMSLHCLPPPKSKLNEPMINYVGKLNEYHTRVRQPPPTYTDSLIQNGQFCLVCSLSNLKAEGYGYNRKEAKQNAAKAMLHLIRENVIEDVTEPAPETILQVNDNSSEALKKYCDLVKNIKIEPYENGNNTETADKEINIDTWDELTAFLTTNGYNYELTTFQQRPLILSLKINEDVLMHYGNTKEEIQQKLVVDAVAMLKKGIDFIKPLGNL